MALRPASLARRTLILRPNPLKRATVTLPTGRNVTDHEPGIRWRVIGYTRDSVSFRCVRSGFTFTEPWSNIANLLRAGWLQAEDDTPLV